MNAVLGIETSCDECSAAVVQHDPDPHGPGTAQVIGISTFSQIKIHQPYGGVVPEIASRNHLETINPMIEAALAQAGVRYEDLSAVAVTNRPGLVGALLVGVSAAKAMAYAVSKPLLAVHHLEGHISSLFLDQPARNIELPLLVAVVSGGHTHLYLLNELPPKWSPTLLKDALIGRSRDDAAGEAFDKSAKLLGFPYPGGVWIDRTAVGGNPAAFAFPRAMPQKSVLDFSFSGLKTAVSLKVRELREAGELEDRLPDLCASIQEAIVDVLWSKIRLAVEKHGCRGVAIVGGVAANSRLRAILAERCPVPVLLPKPEYCTDNGAMIALAGAFRYQQGMSLSRTELLSLNAVPYPEY